MLKKREDYNGYMRKFMLERYHRRRAAAIAQLGGKCAKCGSTEKLEFDHIDPKQKSFSIWCRTYSEEKLLEELKKCQLLCREHHNLKTIADRGFKVAKGSHGTVSSYRYCHCDECRAAIREYNRKKRLLSGRVPRVVQGHGSCGMYQRGCRCDECRCAHNMYMREYRNR